MFKPYSQYKCKENNCNNLISYNSFHYGLGRCKSCANIGERNPGFNSKKQCGKNHWNYKHGNNCKYKEYYCIEEGCKNKVFYGNNRCIKHGNLISAKKRSISLKRNESVKGKNNPNYKHGKRSFDRNINYYCIEEGCNKQVSSPNKRCNSCNIKYRHKIEHFTQGNKNGNWINGKTIKYPSKFNTQLKETIRKKDNYKCKICNKSQKQNKRKLDCHHIDYNKKNNDIDNLIALCKSCHIKTNHNRNYWINYFNNYETL